MINIEQVKKDFENGVIISRETIRQVIDLAVGKFVIATETPKWVNVNDALPNAELFLVKSIRDSDDEFEDGIHQYDGMWVVRPGVKVNSDYMRRWAANHEVTHWMEISDAPIEPDTQKEGA